MLPPLPPSLWDRACAAHLLNRAGFGGPPAEWEALWELGPQGAVEMLLRGVEDTAQFPRPAWAEPEDEVAWRATLKPLDEETRQARQQERRKRHERELRELVAWWVGRMARTPHPLREKMTLFWHGHFATSANKVRQPYYHWLQNETLRHHALGNFGELARAILRDPAMLLYLDGTRSRRNRPNENFAREVMELFILGIGHYSERDVREAARAFTGYKVSPSTQAYEFLPKQHDDGVKQLFGKRGRLDGDAVIEILLGRPSCAPFLARKLCVFFVCEEPPPALVATVAQELVRQRFELAPTLRTLFCSRAFYEPAVRGNQIKSPVQWVVGTARLLQAPPPGEARLFSLLRQTGQLPFHPPSVKGWDGGRSWITTSTLLARYNAAPALLGGKGLPAASPLFAEAQATSGGDLMTLGEAASRHLFQNADAACEAAATYLAHHPATAATWGRLLQLLMSTPQYQLA